MTEPENFLERWSRRKREAPDEPRAAPETQPEKKEEAAPPAEGKKPAQPAQPFDIADLPPIDSIAAETDVRVFLQKGVPPELTREALRRAWSSDPAIRDFVGLVENGWDFNDPNAMAGFGPMAAADVARLLRQVIGAPEEAKQAEPLKAVPVQDATPSQDEPASKDDAVLLPRSKDAASQNDPDA
jgi:hypothetical protein